MALTSINRKVENDVINADTLATTTKAGIGALIAGIAGVLPPILKGVAGTHVPRIVQFGGLLLIGLAVIGWAIATAGDAVARAYATAHSRTDNGMPALADAVTKLAANYESAALGTEATPSRPARRPAIAQAIERLATAQENAALGITSELRAVPDRPPALAEAVKALVEQRKEAGAASLVPIPATVDVTVAGEKQRVLGVLLRQGDVSPLNLLVVSEAGTLTLVPTG